MEKVEGLLHFLERWRHFLEKMEGLQQKTEQPVLQSVLWIRKTVSPAQFYCCCEGFGSICASIYALDQKNSVARLLAGADRVGEVCSSSR